MYATSNPATKRALKAAVSAGFPPTIYSPGPFGCAHPGTHYVEGPHYPAPHRWYATVTTDDAGRVLTVK